MTFKRNERLKSEKIITQLFRKGGNSFACYPLRLVYAEIKPMSDVGFGISEGLPPTTDPLSISMSNVGFGVSEELSPKSQIPNPTSESPIEFALSVPKKAFKRAVDRNVLRRRVREAYRLHKTELYKFLKNNALHSDKRFAFMVLYTAKEEMPYAEIEKGMKKMIRKFKEEMSK